MSDDQDKTVLVFRNKAGTPVPVPKEVVYDSHRAYRTYDAVQGGMHWVDAARQEGYPTTAAARSDVRRWLTEAGALVSDWSRRELLQLKLAQLEELRLGVWGKATGKDDPEKGPHLPSAIFARDLIMGEAKLLRLDETLESEEEQGGPRTVVVSSDSYLTTLESVLDSE